MKIQTIAVIGVTVAVAWWMLKKKGGLMSRDARNVVSYGGTLMSQEQAAMIASQDAAFVSGAEQYLVAPFHA